MSALDRELPFAVDAEGYFFEKAGEGSKKRRVAGVVSNEEEDQDGQVLLQDGLDFEYFLSKGFFNEHHERSIGGIVGYPELVQKFKKGDTLPNGALAKGKCTYAEGHLLENDPRADVIWQKGLALKGTPRSLHFSVEGKVRALSPDQKYVVKAIVRNCAITAHPVNANGVNARLFMKALDLSAGAEREDLERAWDAFAKALDVRSDAVGGAAPKTNLSRAQAVDVVVARYPGISRQTAKRVVAAIAARASRRT